MTISSRFLIMGTVALATALNQSTLQSEDWPTFRGPQRSGVSSETGLLKSWPEEGPPLLWKATGVGRGYSSLAISHGRIFTLGDGISEDDENEYLLAFDQKDGKPLWKTKTGAPWTKGQSNWQSSRSTPSSDGVSVYVISPHGVLLACDAATGDELWRKDLKKDFAGSKGDGWGYSESPLIDGDTLVCTPGGENATMVALDKKSGDLIWKASQPGNRGAGHSSIVSANVGGVKVYVQMTSAGAIGVRSGDGEILWAYQIDRTTAVCPTPVIKDDFVFIAAGYKRGGALLKQKPAGDGKVEIEEIYPMKIQLANKHGGIVRVGDHVYGDSDDAGIPYCADMLTGEIQWKHRGSGKNSASFTAAEDRLYIHFSSGRMVLAKAQPTEYEEVGSFQVPGSGERPSWSHPVISGGRLYLRENDQILCYDIHE